jgi:hypothetical protein
MPYDINSLFGGLEVYRRYVENDPTLGNLLKESHFVIRLDLGEAVSGRRLNKCVLDQLSRVARSAFANETLADRIFNAACAGSAIGHLVDAIPKGVSVVILVDEYDKAILKDIRKDDVAAATAGLDALESLMMSSKSAYSGRIRKFIVTGSTRIAWTSLFSGANNFTDLTHSLVLSDILGFSEKDVRDLIAAVDDDNPLKQDPAGTFKHLKEWYNGYCFDGVRTVFHPYGVLSCLSDASATNTALEGISATSWLNITEEYLLEKISGEVVVQDQSARIRNKSLGLDELGRSGNKQLDMRCLLHQTGYLTEVPESMGTALMVPNEHARNIIKGLISRAQYNDPQGGTSVLGGIFARRDIAAFGKLIRDTFEATPYDIMNKAMRRKAGEYVFHINVLHWAALFRSRHMVIESGTPVQSGALDLAISFPQDNTLWVIEFGVARKDDTTFKVADFVTQKLHQAERYAIGNPQITTTYCLAVVFQKTIKASAAGAEEVNYATSLALSRRFEDANQQPVFKAVEIA